MKATHVARAYFIVLTSCVSNAFISNNGPYHLLLKFLDSESYWQTEKQYYQQHFVTTTYSSSPSSRRSNHHGAKATYRSNEIIRRRGDNRKRSQAIARNRKISDLGRQGKWKEMLNLYDKEREEFDNVNYATMMNQIARIKGVNAMDPLFTSFVKDLADQMEKNGLKWMRVRETANVVYSIGRIKKLRSNDCIRILQLVSTKGHAKWLVTEGKAQEVANTAWAFATLGQQSPSIFNEIENRIDLILEQAKPQEVSNIAWAFATLGKESKRVFGSIKSRTAWLAKKGKPQHLATINWSFVKFGMDPPFNVEKQMEALVIRDGNIQEIAKIALTHAKSGVTSSKLFTEIDKHAALVVEKGTIADISQIATAFLKSGNIMLSSRLITEIDRHAEALVREGSAQAIANIFFASSQMKYFTPNLANEVDINGERLINDGSSSTQHIANIALSFAILGYDASTFFTALEMNIEKFLKEGNTQEICNTCYSLVILDLSRRHKILLQQLFSKLLTIKPESFSNEALTQLTLIEAYARQDKIKLVEPSRALRQRMVNADHDDMPSIYQKQISNLLTEIGFDHEEHVSPLATDVHSNYFESSGRRSGTVTSSILSIDIACQERRIAIEYDGLHHFLLSLQNGKVLKKEDGPTKAKRRFLIKSGWKVINLDYREYMKCEDKLQKVEWLQNVLTTAKD